MFFALAQTTSAPTTQPHFAFVPHLPTHWPAQPDLIQWCQQMSPGTAALLVLAGVIYMMFGWYAFKGLVTINAGLAGACLGAIIGDRIADEAIIGALVGGVLAAATTWPMMKYSIAGMGGILGALVGAALWKQFDLQTNLVWAGALIGLIMFGALSFALFKPSVMMYTALQGAGMFIFGVLGLCFKYQSITPEIVRKMHDKQFLLPLAIFIPAMLGLIYQQHNYGESETAGAGGAKKKK